MGTVREVTWLDRPQAVARAIGKAEENSRTTLAVFATHEEIDRVKEAIRTAASDTWKLIATKATLKDTGPANQNAARFSYSYTGVTIRFA